MGNKFKYYVVWEGLAPGIYDSWEECQLQVKNYKGAKYKSFPTKDAAIKAFRAGCDEHLGIVGQLADVMKKSHTVNLDAVPEYLKDSLAVDASCLGNPGIMEYRGVSVRTGKEIFRQGPFEDGTNNVGEFLALVHGLALLKQQNSSMTICSDSRNAMAWVRDKKCKTKLVRTEKNTKIFELIARAEKWLAENTYPNRLVKWETKEWGEIPADFGRK